jgi:hypothetical protein
VLAFNVVDIDAMRRLDVWERGGLQERGREEKTKIKQLLNYVRPTSSNQEVGHPKKRRRGTGAGEVEAQKIKAF